MATEQKPETGTQERTLMQWEVQPEAGRLMGQIEAALLEFPEYCQIAAAVYSASENPEKEFIRFKAGEKQYRVNRSVGPDRRCLRLIRADSSFKEEAYLEIDKNPSGICHVAYLESGDYLDEILETNTPTILKGANTFVERLKRDLAAEAPKATPEE